MTRLTAEQLYARCDPASLDFATTADLPDIEGPVGQQRAVQAVEFGVAMTGRGYNLFVHGPAGTGKHTIVREMLERRAAGEAVPAEWCYVNNFADPHKPRALSLPPGRGAPLQAAMRRMIDDLRVALPAGFESDDYRARREVIDEQFKQRHEKVFGEFQSRAQGRGIALIRTPMGLALAPTREGEVVTPDRFGQLSGAEQQRIKADIEAMQAELEGIVRKVPQWEREHRDEVRKLHRDITRFAVGHVIDELRAGVKDLPLVVEYLDAVERDLIENAERFLRPAHGGGEMGESEDNDAAPGMLRADGAFRRYQVNLIVDRRDSHGAPVIYEDHPTHQNMVGRVEHQARFGALITDFNLIKGGALHRANGGYLVLDALKLLMNLYAWESLKRALRSGEIRIESLEQLLSLVSTVSLEPASIPLNVKVVLVGEPTLYYLLSELDPDFREMFKVAADFDDRLERDPETIALYSRLVATLARREKIRPLDKGAVARLIEYAARLTGDGGKITTELRSVVDLMREADHWAGQHGVRVLTQAHVQQAIDGQIRRADRVYRRLQEEIQRGTLRIETAGESIGQVNGLSVMSPGGFVFGHPSRITARVRLGRGEVVDIEREVKLGGPLHSKGVLILSGFLGGRFGGKKPLSLAASLVFEQSYGGIDGDSASSAELYALLSALADAPIKQSFAVTGSVDQRGQVQAIGGVNEKIEAFFDACKARGLTGDQGVLIPEANKRHLMLRADVVEAAAAGRFHIHAVEHIDQGIEILTGIPAGAPDAAGEYPAATINRRVADRLAALAEQAAAFGLRGGVEKGHGKNGQ